MKMQICAIAISLAGSGAFASSSDVAAKSAFDGVVARCKAAYESRSAERPGWSTSVGHSKIRTTGLSTSYDIRRTDSLVSPYLATLEQSVTSESTAFHKTAEQATADLAFLPRIQSLHTFLFAFQDGGWVFRSMSTSTRYIKDGTLGRPSRVDDKPDRFADGTPRPSFICAYGNG